MSAYVTKFETTQGDKQYSFQHLCNFPVCQAGQVLKVTAVDKNGQPTAWEAFDIDAYIDEKLGTVNAVIDEINGEAV